MALLEIDVQGAEKISKKMPGFCNFLFFNAPSQEELRRRLQGRYCTRPNSIA